MRISVAAAMLTATVAALLATGTAQAAAAAQPSASVSAIDCVNGGAYANLNNTSGEPATFTISVDGSTIDTVELEGASYGTSRLVPVAEDAIARIRVSADGMDTVTRTVARNCARGGAGGAGAVAGVSAQLGATGPAPRGATGQLPFTGAGAETLLGGAGALLVVLGIALLSAARPGARRAPLPAPAAPPHE